MKRKITTLLAVLLSAAVFMPLAANACDGACGGGNNTAGTWHHHGLKQDQQAGAGEGLNNGVNLSLDQNQQSHNQSGKKGKNWGPDHKKHNNSTPG